MAFTRRWCPEAFATICAFSTESAWQHDDGRPFVVGDGAGIGDFGREVARRVAGEDFVLRREIYIAGKLHDTVFECDVLHTRRTNRFGELGSVIDAHRVRDFKIGHSVTM